MRCVTADDSTIMAPMLQVMLRNIGHEVVAHAFNGQDALDLVREHKPDFVVFDVLMPIMQGNLAAQTLNSEKLLTPDRILLATSQGQDAVVKPLRDAGFGVIIKPYKEGQLKALIEAHCKWDA